MENDKEWIDSRITTAVILSKVKTLEEEVTQLKNDRTNALKWGIAVLGTGVVSMGLWIFNLFGKMLP